jgi:hypothetical protein
VIGRSQLLNPADELHVMDEVMDKVGMKKISTVMDAQNSQEDGPIRNCGDIEDD